jgi:pseudaminic acid biosynthesis-associated methylase
MERAETEKLWQGEFGAAYTERNPRCMSDLDALYRKQFGTTRTEVNQELLADVDRTSRVLEVGVNVGLQLQGLRQLGFTALYGVDLQRPALAEVRTVAPEARVACASAMALPFPDNSFDLVFTSALLIHIPPDLAVRVMAEIHRCSRRWIWGWEYFAEVYTPVSYRGQENALWKTNFPEAYLKHFADLIPVRERRMHYKDSDLADTVFLLKKGL